MQRVPFHRQPSRRFSCIRHSNPDLAERMPNRYGRHEARTSDGQDGKVRSHRFHLPENVVAQASEHGTAQTSTTYQNLSQH